MASRVRVLVISGSMGSGKTTVLAEATDLLMSADVAHAAIDLDFLLIAHAPRGVPHDLKFRNLAAVWTNYSAAGIQNLLLCEPIDSVETRERLRQTIPCNELIVCRLRAPLATMQERIRRRETGVFQDKYVERVAALERELDAGTVEDFSVENDGRPVTEVARELLVRAGWL
jgi:hypothetical protein